MRRLWLAILVCSVKAAAPTIAFEEIAGRAGLSFVLRNAAAGQFHQIELTGAGVAVFDYNNDGCADIFFANGAAIPSLKKTGAQYANRLFKNNCNLTFTDVTAPAGLEGEGYSQAVAAADYDNDGWTDLYVTGVRGNTLYRNGGNGRFADVTAKATVGGGQWAVSAAWFDADNDGWLDLFVSNYVVWEAGKEPRCGSPEQQFYCHPREYPGLANQLFRNQGDGTFRDISQEAGMASHIGKGMGVAVADFDGDGWMDVFVANDSVRSFLFHNRGGGKFEEVGLEAGVALREDGYAIAGMGADFRDFDNDGRPDLVVSGILNDSFQVFRGQGQTFEDVGSPTGLLMATRQDTGWSLGLYDFDNDGWKDVFFALSHLASLDRYLGRPSALANRVFRNEGGKRMVDVKAFHDAAMNRGVAFGDFDNDGRVDAVVSVLNGPAKLLRNTSGAAGHWLALELRGTRSNRQGLGAKVRVQLADGRELFNHATTAVGYASSSEALVRFGLGTQVRAQRVEILWPSGAKQELRDVTADRVLKVTEPAGEKTP